MDTLWPFYHDRKEPEPGRPRPRSTNSEISCVPSGHRKSTTQEDWSLNPFSFISSSTSTSTPDTQQQSSEGTSGLFFVPYFFGTTPSEKKNEHTFSSSSSSRFNDEATPRERYSSSTSVSMLSLHSSFITLLHLLYNYSYLNGSYVVVALLLLYITLDGDEQSNNRQHKSMYHWLI